MSRNANSLDNFKTTASTRFAIVDMMPDDPITFRSQELEFASAATAEKALERAFRRLLVRNNSVEREIIMKAQRLGHLNLVKITGAQRVIIEPVTLLVA